jgi:hypothetical protein
VDTDGLSRANFSSLDSRRTQKHDLLLIHVDFLSLYLQSRHDVFVDLRGLSKRYLLHRRRLYVSLSIRLLFLLFLNNNLGPLRLNKGHYDALLAGCSRRGLRVSHH